MIQIKRATMMRVLVGLVFSAVMAGCSTDNAGFKPEHKATKAEIQQTISEVRSSKKITAGVKSMVISRLEKQLASAK